MKTRNYVRVYRNIRIARKALREGAANADSRIRRSIRTARENGNLYGRVS